MSSNAEETDPNIKQRIAEATKRADPFFDRGMAAAANSQWTPWIVAGVILAAVLFGVWVAW